MHPNLSGLNYTLANEDTGFEYSFLKPDSEHIVSVAGSGSRVFPFLAKNPKKVSCIDLSLNQLRLTELRVESTRLLSFAEFQAFWGYHTCSTIRRQQLFSLG